MICDYYRIKAVPPAGVPMPMSFCILLTPGKDRSAFFQPHVTGEYQVSGLQENTSTLLYWIQNPMKPAIFQQTLKNGSIANLQLEQYYYLINAWGMYADVCFSLIE